MSIERALAELRPGCAWYIQGSPEYSNITWTDKGSEIPTEDEVKQKMAEIVAQDQATLYAVLRKEEYMKLNQFEMQFNDAMNGTTTWLDAVNAIKAKYPKPDEVV